MQKIILAFWAMHVALGAFSQNTLTVIIKDIEKKETLKSVSVFLVNSKNQTISDKDGLAQLKNIPDGSHVIGFSMIGYQQRTDTIRFPLNLDKPYEVFLETRAEEMDQVIIASTKTGRTIRNTPTRIEVIDFEELDEKNNMKPANVSMILHESTGIQVQQTSPTSANASIRIQGLDGRYTQLLKDGYPGFGNFASGLSILEIPPTDLKQVEVIKGPASTLYGAGAIAGVVNFISKTPAEKGAYSFIFNQSNVGQTNIAGFALQRNKKIGYSILAQANFQKPYDVDKDDFTELPKSNDFTIHPKLFYYPTPKATFMIGNSFSKGRRTGGDLQVLAGKEDNFHTYFESNITLRNTTTLDYIQTTNGKNQFTLKSGFTFFKRKISIPDHTFEGINYNSFNDIAYIKRSNNQTLILGGNIVYDKFLEQGAIPDLSRNFQTSTIGLYVQQAWDVTEKIKLENGFRVDRVNYENHNYQKAEVLFLPRVSMLYKFNAYWSSRIGGGLGYKTPTVFTEQTETIQYRQVLPLNNVTSERSYGGTADVNFKTSIGSDLDLNINQLFFYTKIANATFLDKDNLNNFYFVNSDRPVTSIGFESNARLIFKEAFKLFVGYTLNEAKANFFADNPVLKLVPRHKVNLTLMYEKEKIIKVGLEGYFTGKQFLNNNTSSPSFWEFGFMVEKTFGAVSVFLNAENFTDTRQSRYKRVAGGPHDKPTFDDIWTHTEGRTFNGGLKWRF